MYCLCLGKTSLALRGRREIPRCLLFPHAWARSCVSWSDSVSRVLACSSSDFGAGSCSGQLCLCAMSSQAVCLVPESLLEGTSSCSSLGLQTGRELWSPWYVLFFLLQMTRHNISSSVCRHLVRKQPWSHRLGLLQKLSADRKYWGAVLS